MKPADDWKQRVAAFVFVMVLEYAAGVVTPTLPRDYTYYVGCFLINLVSWPVVHGLFQTSTMISDFKKLILLQAAMQLLGLFLYLKGIDAKFYNAAIKAVVFTTYIRILLGSWLRYEPKPVPTPTPTA
jgi:hypothetical protein